MKQIALATLLCLTLPGCAVFGVGMAGLAAENVALGDDSYTNKALDYTCDQTSDSDRQSDGSCPGR